MGPKQFGLIALTLFCVLSTASSQDRPARPPASDFNVEILNLDARNHIFSIPGSPVRAGYIAHINLTRVPDWKPSDDVPEEVAALRLQFWLDDGVSRIEVTAHLGKIAPHSRPYEWNKLTTTTVAARTLPPGELVTISETERFGIVPFQIRAFRAKPWSVGPPQVTNKTQSLNAVAVSEDRPVYMVTVRNLSHKHIKSLRWYGLEDGRKSGGSGISGERVVSAGGLFEIRQHFGFTEERAKTDSAESEPVQTREIVIAAILFDDGTFEGEADEAAEMAAHMAGQDLQLKRVQRLLRPLTATQKNRQARALKKLKRDVTSLSEEVNPKFTLELLSRFAAASEDMRNRRIREEVANGLRFVKNELLREIEKFGYQSENSPKDADFETWLNQQIENFKTIGIN